MRVKSEFAEAKIISGRSAGVLAEFAETGSASSVRQRAGGILLSNAFGHLAALDSGLTSAEFRYHQRDGLKLK